MAVLVVSIAVGSVFARRCAAPRQAPVPKPAPTFGKEAPVDPVAKSAGLRKKRLRRENGELVFEVSVGALKGCTFGDMVLSNGIVTGDLTLQKQLQKQLENSPSVP